MEVFHYITPDNKNPFREWFRSLRDPRAKAAIFRRLDRLVDNNFGDHKFCREGVWELKCGGSKRTQRKDIDLAVAYWKDYQERST
jgi:putative component of toxin-antitoxin plasmid stabilization module